MIRRWIRALARTGLPTGRALTSPPAGWRLRTVLRLEAVEDRTLASAVPLHQPEPVAAAGHVQKATPSDDKDQPVGDGADTPVTDAVLTDGFNSGSQASPTPAAGAPLSMAWDLKTASATIELPAPRAQLTTDRAQNFAGESEVEEPTAQPAKARADKAGETVAPVIGDTNGTTPPAGNPSPPAAPPTTHGSSVAPNNPAPTTSGSPVTGTADAKGGSSRAVTVDADPAAARVSRDGRAPRTTPAIGRTQNPAMPANLTDGALLQRFAANRDEAAFAALVQRHGRLVLGVCQRVLGDFHAAQDASQATFMVLARKAGMLDRSSPLGGWLYRVAYHLALRSRAVAARQRLGEREAADERPDHVTENADLDQREMHQVLREELQGLPEKYRAPLALVYIDGRSHADAAQAIGLPRGSIAKRVGEGLDRLRERLVHRGLVL